MDSIPQKQCSLCGESFPETLEYFAQTKYGLRADCRECQRARARKNYWSDPEKHKQDSRNRNSLITPEQRLNRNERDREWRKANPDKVKSSKKRDYEKHKDKRKSTMRVNYEQKKPGIHCAWSQMEKRKP